MESKEDSDTDSKDKNIDWGLTFMLLKNRGFFHEEILNLSYPQFNAYMKKINEPLTFSITIPYMGNSDDNKNEQKIDSSEELLNIIADMNKEFV